MGFLLSLNVSYSLESANSGTKALRNLTAPCVTMGSRAKSAISSATTRGPAYTHRGHAVLFYARSLKCL